MNKSNSITNLFKALYDAQTEIKNPPKTAVNEYYKSSYTPLDELLELVKPILLKHGLMFIQVPSGKNETITVTTTLIHVPSAEFIEFDPLSRKIETSNPQVIGSLVSYFKRYALMSILAIAGKEDDDSNRTLEADKNKKTPVTPSQAPKDDIKIIPLPDTITPQQQRQLFRTGTSQQVREVISQFGYKNTAEIKQIHFDEIYNALG